jgi:hypothetical protein
MAESTSFKKKPSNLTGGVQKETYLILPVYWRFGIGAFAMQCRGQHGI